MGKTICEIPISFHGGSRLTFSLWITEKPDVKEMLFPDIGEQAERRQMRGISHVPWLVSGDTFPNQRKSKTHAVRSGLGALGRGWENNSGRSGRGIGEEGPTAKVLEMHTGALSLGLNVQLYLCCWNPVRWGDEQLLGSAPSGPFPQPREVRVKKLFWPEECLSHIPKWERVFTQAGLLTTTSHLLSSEDTVM